MADDLTRPPENPQDQGVSLQELAAAFAQAMASQPQAAVPPEPVESAVSHAEAAAEAAETETLSINTPVAGPSVDGDDGPYQVSPTSILEAMLFVGDPSGGTLTAARAAELMRGVAAEEVPQLVEQLNRRYAANGCPYRIEREGLGYRMTLAPDFHGLRTTFYGRVREARLSQAALDILAIVAYRQPITSDDVTRARGTPSGPLLTQLVRRRLLRIERPEGKRQPVSYRTTERFLNLLGLRGLEDLPRSEEP